MKTLEQFLATLPRVRVRDDGDWHGDYFYLYTEQDGWYTCVDDQGCVFNWKHIEFIDEPEEVPKFERLPEDLEQSMALHQNVAINFILDHLGMLK